MLSCGVCQSLRLSRSCRTLSQRINLQSFSPSGSHTILVFPHSLPHRPPRISNRVHHNQHGRPQRRLEKRRKQTWIVRSGKSEAEVTNNRRLRSRFCTIEANYWYAKHRAASLRSTAIVCFPNLIWASASGVFRIASDTLVFKQVPV